jgi:tRNA modification GTPase
LALAAAEQVDLVCITLDAATLVEGPPAPFLEGLRGLELPSAIVSMNKCDLIPAAQRPHLLAVGSALGFGPAVLVSALTGEGLNSLRERFLDALGSTQTTTAAESVWMTERQRSAAAETLNALRRAEELAAQAAETIDCADLLAFELREALDALGEITGAVTTEDLLSHVFANFCIGK